jgi:hypothetical protein
MKEGIVTVTTLTILNKRLKIKNLDLQNNNIQTYVIFQP